MTFSWATGKCSVSSPALTCFAGVRQQAAFSSFRYYEGGASSVYFWDLDNTSFAACVLFKKDAQQLKKLEAGNWDAIHVIEVRPLGGSNKTTYKLTSTIMLRIATDHSVATNAGKLNLSGSLTRQIESTLECEGGQSGHIANMGRLVEDMENRMRDTLQAVYFGKTKAVVNGIYKGVSGGLDKQKAELAKALQAEMARRD